MPSPAGPACSSCTPPHSSTWLSSSGCTASSGPLSPSCRSSSRATRERGPSSAPLPLQDRGGGNTALLLSLTRDEVLNINYDVFVLAVVIVFIVHVRVYCTLQLLQEFPTDFACNLVYMSSVTVSPPPAKVHACAVCHPRGVRKNQRSAPFSLSPARRLLGQELRRHSHSSSTGCTTSSRYRGSPINLEQLSREDF